MHLSGNENSTHTKSTMQYGAWVPKISVECQCVRYLIWHNIHLTYIYLKDRIPTDLEFSLTPLLNQDHSESAVGVAATMAHEMGHNFGMSHDSTGCCQARAEDGGCIMAAATGYETDITVKLSQLMTCVKKIIFCISNFLWFSVKYPICMCTSQVMNSAVFLLFGLKEKAKLMIYVLYELQIMFVCFLELSTFVDVNVLKSAVLKAAFWICNAWICVKPCRLSQVCMVIHSWIKSYLCAKIYCSVVVGNVFLAVLNEKKQNTQQQP